MLEVNQAKFFIVDQNVEINLKRICTKFELFVQIFDRSNRTQCSLRLATAATFLRVARRRNDAEINPANSLLNSGRVI